jgi:hypothetical protein
MGLAPTNGTSVKKSIRLFFMQAWKLLVVTLQALSQNLKQLDLVLRALVHSAENGTPELARRRQNSGG